MSGKLKKKIVLVLAAEILILILLGVILTAAYTRLAVNSQKKNTQIKLEQIKTLLADSEKESEETSSNYDANCQSKAESIAYLYTKGEVERTDSKLKEIQEIANVTNILLLDRKGNIIAKAKSSRADFTYNRFNQLRTVFDSKGLSTPFEVTSGGRNFRYYGAKLDENTMVVIEQDPEELDTLLVSTTAYDSLLKNISVGQDGYPIVISDQTKLFSYHPDEELEGTDALEAGISPYDLKDGHYGWMTIDGEEFYCGTALIEEDYVICAVPKSEIVSSRNVTVAVIVFVAFAVMTLVSAYGCFVLQDEERKGMPDESNFKAYRHFRYNKIIGRKALAISIVGLLCILLVSFYMQTLFALSMQSLTSDQKLADIRSSLQQSKEEIELVTEDYNETYLDKCRIATYILKEDPALMDREVLQEMCEILDIQAISCFDVNGELAVTSTPFTNFTLSEDPKDQSYEFRNLLVGMESLVQEAQPDDTSGEMKQYIGVALCDDEGVADGFVQICVNPERLEQLLENQELAQLLNGIKVGNNGFTFAVGEDSKKFTYYPDENMIGKKALSHGIKKAQLSDSFNDYLKIDGNKYYGSSMEYEDNFIYVVVPDENLNSRRLPLTLLAGAVSLVGLCILLLLISMSLRRKETAAFSSGVVDPEERDSKESRNRTVEIISQDGSVRRTETAMSRWGNMAMKWAEQTPEQRITTVLRWLVFVSALIICIAVLFKERFFDETSVFRYVIDGEWTKGLNIFAFTGGIMIVCVIATITMLVQRFLRLLSTTVGAKGETICRMLRGFAKYVSIIITLYYLLSMLGVNTATLLTSAGILSLVVGLGAQSLIADVLAGLFLIFEGEFRVGDIVTVGDWRGEVLEVGVRTTKVKDADQNIKIISNSEIGGIINMTRQYSYACCDVGIEYGESLEHVEAVLRKELPNIKKALPSIQNGPYYKGVVSLGDSSVVIRIIAECKETDRVQLGRDLNRAIKILFDHYNIGIPFPQIVVNQPEKHKGATDQERLEAEEFQEEQKKLSRDIAEE